jgi:hypothetical protein
MAEIVVNNFNGGINNIVEPHLLETNFSVDLRNARIQNGAIKSLNGIKVVSDNLDEGLMFQDGQRSVVKYGGTYFWSDNVTGELDSSLGYLGVTTPTTKPSALGGEVGFRFNKGTAYRYFYTFKTADSIRSAPFSVTDTEQFSATKDLNNILVSGFDPVMDDHVVAVEVWRTVDAGADFFKAGEAPRDGYGSEDGIVFNDRTLDVALVLNEKYDITNVTGKPATGRFMTERNSIFYIADGDQIFFSEPANPHNYNILNFITFDDTITGAISTENFTLVFTRNRAYQLTGDSIVDIVKQEIPDSQGVKNWQTVSRVKNMPLWISNDGLCAYQPYDNRSGRKIQVLSENIFEIPKNPLYAVVANDVYYLFFEEETVAFDFVLGFRVYRIDWKFDWAWYDKDDDLIIGKKKETFYEAGGGDELDFTYTSPDFIGDDMQRLKQLSRIYADSDNDLEITFFVEGVEVWSFILEHEGINSRRSFIDPVVQGRRIQVKIKSKGILRGITFDYILRRL